MTLTEWQSNQLLTKWAATVFDSNEGRELLSMLNDSHVKNSQVSLALPADTKSSELGKIYGYDVALNNIEAAKKFIPPRPKLEESFGAIRAQQKVR